MGEYFTTSFTLPVAVGRGREGGREREREREGGREKERERERRGRERLKQSYVKLQPIQNYQDDEVYPTITYGEN